MPDAKDDISAVLKSMMNLKTFTNKAGMKL